MLIKITLFSVAISLLLFIGCGQQAVRDQSAAVSAPQVASELDFRDFYKLPIGPYGLEPTGRLLSLAGKPVSIQGYMVKEENPLPGVFMLASLPVNIPEKEDGPSDDLPGATVFVHMPAEDAKKTLVYRNGLWKLFGTLELGSKEEANGRVSYVRLLLE